MQPSKFLLLILAAFALSGCETCHRHPAVCATAVAFAVGSAVIIAGKNDGNDLHRQLAPYRPPVCGPRDPNCKP